MRPLAHRLGRRHDGIPPLVVLLACVASSDAHAIPLSWKLPISGNAGIAANWNPEQIPGAAEVLTFHVGGTYTVTFDGTVPTTTSHLYRSGVVTLIATTHSLTSQLRVGDVNGDVGGLTLTTGTLSANGNVVLGNAAGSAGTLIVDDDDADLVQTFTSDILVANGGQGTLQVTGGGYVQAADKVIVGGTSAAVGTVLVSGVNASPEVRSSLSSSGADGDLVFGSGGTATVTIAAGALASASDDLHIAVTASSQGSVTVQGSSGAFVSALAVSDDLEIATNTVAGPAAGTGSLLVQNSGSVFVNGSTHIGESDGGTGTLRIRPTGLFTSHDLIFNDAHGVLDFQGGTLIVDGGVFDPPGTTLAINDPQPESVQLRDGATASFDGGSAVGYSVIVGDANQGELRLELGAHVSHVNGVLSVGLAPGGNGLLDLSNGSLLDGVGTLVVGQSGSGVLNLTSGGDVSLTSMSVAYAPGSTGIVNLSGAGSVLGMQKIEIGGTGLVAGGTGTVDVWNGGTIQIGGAEVVPIRIVHPGGRLKVRTGGTVNGGGSNLDTRGHLEMLGGQLTIGSVNFAATADLVGHGTVTANIAASSAPDALIHATGGALVLGNSSSDKGFTSAGTLRCDAGAPVTLRDLDGVTLGNVVLNSGSLTLPAGGGTVQAGKTMSGSGTVTGSVTNLGTASPGSSVGTITVGSYNQGATGSLRIEIGNAPASQYDRLVVTGAATLSGALDVRILPGFVPGDGQNFTILTYGSRTGTFSSVTIEGQPVNAQFTINYNPTSVVLHVNHITTDVPPADALPREAALVGRSGPWSSAGFELALPDAAHVVVQLFDASGRRVATLLDGEVAAGVLPLRLRELEPGLRGGVYFGRAIIRTRDVELARTAKVTLLR